MACARFRAAEVYGNDTDSLLDSEVITEWVEYHGWTPNLANADAGARPMFLRRNGMPRVRFDPTKALSANPDMPAGDLPRSLVLMGVNWHTDPDQLFMYQGAAAVNRGLFALGTAPTTGRAAAALDAETFLSDAATLGLGPECLFVSFDGSTVTFQRGVNAPVTLTTDLATDSGGVTVGDVLANFDAYEVLFYDRALVGDDRTVILGYFDGRYEAAAPPSLPSASLLMEWRTSSINGLDSAGVVEAIGLSGQRQYLRPHKASTTGSFVQDTLANRPQLDNAYTPFPYLRFASTQAMTSPVVLPSGTADRTFAFIAMGMQSPDQRLFHYGDMTTDNAGFGLFTDGAGSLQWSGGGAVGGNIGQTSDGKLHVVIVTVGAGGTQVVARVDYHAAIIVAGLSLNTSAVADPATLGDTSASPLFDFVHLLAFTTVLTYKEQTQVVDFARLVYGAPSL